MSRGPLNHGCSGPGKLAEIPLAITHVRISGVILPIVFSRSDFIRVGPISIGHGDRANEFAPTALRFMPVGPISISHGDCANESAPTELRFMHRRVDFNRPQKDVGPISIGHKSN